MLIDGDLYHRSISTADVKSGRTQVNDPGTTLDSVSAAARRPHAPPVIYDNGAVETIAVLFADSDDRLQFTQSPVGAIAFSPDEAVSAAAIDMGAGGSNSAVATLACHVVPATHREGC